jgi:hypothetical protein
MFQLQHVTTDNEDITVLDDFATQEEAWEYAAEWLITELKASPYGSRDLKRWGGEVPQEVIEASFNVVPYIGVWTPCKGHVVPHDESLMTADTDWLIFTDRKGNRYLGEYDFSEGVFRSSSSDTELEPDRVISYIIIPELD